MASVHNIQFRGHGHNNVEIVQRLDTIYPTCHAVCEDYAVLVQRK